MPKLSLMDHPLRAVKFTASALALMALASCSAVPSQGPRAGTFSKAAQEYVDTAPDGEDGVVFPFVMVDINHKNLALIKENQIAKKIEDEGEFTDRRDAADIRIGLGDTVRVTIFEAGSGGLFVPTGGALSQGNFVTIPDQEVDRTGSITVPYAAKAGDGGIISVYDKRPIEVQAEIEQRLADRALDPQVIVNVVNRQSSLYSVIGDVSGPGRFSVPQSGIRILDAIGDAGGPLAQAHNTLITLQRGGDSSTVRMETLLEKPENNVFVRPNDIIALEREERHINIFGAVNANAQLAFDSEHLSLADALGRSGGLDATRAQPHSVIVYREENADLLRKVGAKLAGFEGQETIPTVYRVNLKNPSGLFLARELDLHHNDMVYVSEHPLTEVNKLMVVLRDILLIRLIND
jgi:polysaccharide export outer membrane protein